MVIRGFRISRNHPTFLANFCHSTNNESERMGKVAIIHDMAALTYAKLQLIDFIPG